MSDPAFLTHATRCVQSLLGQLESQDGEGLLELDDTQDGLAILLPGGRQLLLSIHRASGEMWLASPRLGGLHFRFHAAAPHWRLGDGRELYGVLNDDLRALSGVAHWHVREAA